MSFVALTTTSFPLLRYEDTYWDIRDDQGGVATNGYTNYNSYTSYYEHRCLPRNRCYSFNLYDAFGDGLSSGYQWAGYELVVDGSIVAQGGPDNFGYHINHDFGTCYYNCGYGESHVDFYVTTDMYGYVFVA